MLLFYVFIKEDNKRNFITACDNIFTAISIVNDICNLRYENIGCSYIIMGSVNEYNNYFFNDNFTEDYSIYTKKFNGEIITDTTSDSIV